MVNTAGSDDKITYYLIVYSFYQSKKDPQRSLLNLCKFFRHYGHPWCIYWLDRRFLLQTLSHSEDINVEEIRKLLDEDVAHTSLNNTSQPENEVV